MSASTPDILRRLRAANPSPVEADRAYSPLARATLERILSDREGPAGLAQRRLRARLPRRGIGIVVAAALVGGGTALAATNPFGWWSANPGAAKYAVNPTAHVHTPAAAAIRCHTRSTDIFGCSSGGSGQLYTRIDTIHPLPPSSRFTRVGFLKAIARAQATHKLSGAQATKFRRDLAEVPDSFFVKLRLAIRYGTYGGGADNRRVPPPGVPEFIACWQTGGTVTCQNLNGDEHAPIGAGVYIAEPAPDWRPAPSRRTEVPLPPGLRFTRAEYRVLVDMLAGATTTSSSSSSRPTPLPPGG